MSGSPPVTNGYQPADPQAGERWRHFKGDVYRIDKVVRHSETKEKMVVYFDNAGNYWTRPLSMWHDQDPVKMMGKRRFMKVPT